MIRVAALLLVLPAVASPVQLQGGMDLRPRPEAIGRFEVRVSQRDEEGFRRTLMTVRADEASFSDVLRSAAAELGREVVGLERIGQVEPLTVYLVDRPVEDTLHWMAGAVGMRVLVRPDRIQVLQDLPPFPSVAEVHDGAERAYLRAMGAHPEHAQAPLALMDKASIQQQRGNLQAAIDEYDSLINGHHSSPLLAEAMWSSAGMLAELGSWRAAATRLDELASLPFAHPYHVDARIDLAEALCEIGDPQKAVYTLDALETYLQSESELGNVLDSDHSKVRRLITRGLASSYLEQPVEALRTLDLASSYDRFGDFADEITSTRAIALEISERPADAAIAWLKVAEEGKAELRGEALSNAARLSLVASDPLGALFVHRYAEEHGLEGETAEYASEARARLGMSSTLAPLGDQQLLVEAEDLLERGEFDLAAGRFAGLFERRGRLGHGELMRLARGYSEALASDGMLDTAIAALRGIIALLPEAPAQRQELYVHAAALLEQAGRFDDAIEALKGRL